MIRRTARHAKRKQPKVVIACLAIARGFASATPKIEDHYSFILFKI